MPLPQLSTKCQAATLPDRSSHSCANQAAASPVKPRQTQLSAAPLDHHLGPILGCGTRTQAVNSQTNQQPPSLILAGAPAVPPVPAAPGGLQQHKGSFGKWLKLGRHLWAIQHVRSWRSCCLNSELLLTQLGCCDHQWNSSYFLNSSKYFQMPLPMPQVHSLLVFSAPAL